MAKTIENNIRRLRFEHKEMTQQELATRSASRARRSMRSELGKYSPSLEVAFQIAEVFGVPLEKVFQYNLPKRSRT
jgi:putative transcriptional regulator